MGGSTGGASGITSAPPRTATTCSRERTPYSSTSPTSDASLTCGSGTKTRLTPRAEAAITIGRTPGTQRRRPSRVSSPIRTVSASVSFGSGAPLAARIATAIARSKCGPRLGRSAGESRIVILRLVGQSNPLFSMAERHRSRASLIDASARPTSVVAI